MYGAEGRPEMGVSERAFGFFARATPGTSGQMVSASVDDTVRASDAFFTVGLPPAAVISATVRTKVLYPDRNDLRVVYQLRDAIGESRVSLEQLSVSLMLVFDDVTSFELTCNTPTSASGVGECASLLPPTMFSSMQRQASLRVIVRYGTYTPLGSAQAGSIVLRAALVQSSLVSAGVVAVLPESPRFIGDFFEVEFRAHTGVPNFALVGWNVALEINSQVLDLVQVDFNSVYTTPTYRFVNHAARAVFSVVATGLSSGYTTADVMGASSLLLMKLGFVISNQISSGAHHAINGTVGAFVNQGTQRYLSNTRLRMTDYRGGRQNSGALIIEHVRSVGVLAVSETATLVNTATLHGSPSEHTIQVLELYDRAASPAALSMGYTCHSLDPMVVSVLPSSCTLSVAAHQAGGLASVDVQSVNGTSLVQVPFAVWAPLTLQVFLRDTHLGALDGLAAATDCAVGEQYQTTSASAAAVFGGGNLTSTGLLDVSILVVFSSSDPSVIAIKGSTILGVAPGSALVNAEVAAAGLAPTAAAVSVSSDAVAVVALRTAVVTHISWVQSPPSVYPWLPLDGSFAVRARLEHAFSREGDSGVVVVNAVFADGSEQALPASQLAVASETSSLDASLQGDVWRVGVSVGAVRSCGILLSVDWKVCNRTVVSSGAAVNIQMPSVDAISAQAAHPRLAPAGDGATVTPISISSSTSIFVSVLFSDGTSRGMSTDSRLLLELDGPSGGCAEIHGVNGVRILPGSTCDTLTVKASIPSLASGVYALATITVVRLSHVVAYTFAHPTYQSPREDDEWKVLERFHLLGCSGQYQRGQLYVGAMLTDESVVVVSSQSVVDSLTPDVLSVIQVSGVWLVVPVAAGSGILSVTFEGHRRLLERVVTESELQLSSISLTIPGVSGVNRMTFGGLYAITRPVSVRLTFANGLIVTDMTTLDWLPFSSLISLESSDLAAIVAQNSSFRLMGNGLETSLTARSACDSSMSSTLLVAPNLHPDVGDVDLGLTRGLQFQQTGLQLRVPVSANVNDGRLVNYQVEVYFDPEVFTASSCVGGALQGFTCTINDPLERVKLIANDLTSTVSGSLVDLGTFSLEVRLSGVTFLNGTIVELIRMSAALGTEIRTRLQPIAAGSGFADVRTSGARRQMRSTGGHSYLASEKAHARRQLLTRCELENGCFAGRYGDVNGDCLLTSYDVLWAEQVIVGDRALGELCPWAQLQLDPTLDGEAATVEDAYYLRLAAANKYRFLDPNSVRVDSSLVVGGSSNALSVTVRVFTDTSEPADQRTHVRVEIGYSHLGGQLVCKCRARCLRGWALGGRVCCEW